jgi:hypothetical protein
MLAVPIILAIIIAVAFYLDRGVWGDDTKDNPKRTDQEDQI